MNNQQKKLLVIALGGNALLKRGQSLDYSYMKQNIAIAARTIAKIAKDYKIIIVHGNGPQIGLLALQNNAYKEVNPYPFDILNAESQAMIGYPLQQKITNFAKDIKAITLITQSIISPKDPALNYPTKFIGSSYSKKEAKKLAAKYSWQIKSDGKFWRRIVPSPKPVKIVEMSAISNLIKENFIVIAGGGGSIPCLKKNNSLVGMEAVIDKDYTAALIAKELKADRLVILTDTDAVYENFGKPNQKPIGKISVNKLKKYKFPKGSMLPKIEAACDFASSNNRTVNIGSLDQFSKILENKSGTLITPQ